MNTNPSSPTVDLLTNDAPDHIVEAAAEKERKDAFTGVIAWHGVPLLWTSSRAGLYDFLRIPAPALSPATLAAIKQATAAEGTDQATALQVRADELYQADTGGVTGHVRNATIILWLAAHQPKDWRSLAHDRARLLELIDEWVDEHVAPGEVYDLAAITNRLLKEADATRAISRPRHTNPDDEGN